MAFFKLTFTRAVVALFLAYLAYNCFTVYHIFNPAQCSGDAPKRCVTPAYRDSVNLDLWVYVSPRDVLEQARDATLLLHKENLPRAESFVEEVNVTLPHATLSNGSLYAFVFLGPGGKSPLRHNDVAYLSKAVVPVTKYAVPKGSTFNLLSGSQEDKPDTLPATHWIPWLTIHHLGGDWRFDRNAIPGELLKAMQFFPRTIEYLPLIYIDRSRVRDRSLKLVSRENGTMVLEVSYASVGMGRMRLSMLFAESMKMLNTMGFGDKELDDVRGLLDNDLWLLGLTFLIAFFHILFDFLAFKNDISFWKKRKTMTGLSTRTILWRCFSQAVVFLYLLEEKTSLLVQVPAGIASVIEFWKVGKALKLEWRFSGCVPYLARGKKIDAELQSETFDSQAMHYLSYLLYPLVVAGAVYQLLYASYRSWYSWLIRSLVNGVYAFGFLFMLPQLFLNYKLKSVAHLPWKAFMYKAFNTFIDDVFAFIIVMPTAHRIAVFRDDLVFLVYLYQRWLYPVDKARVNEFGESFEPKKEHKD